MGKISKALAKYASERKTVEPLLPPRLAPQDLVALANFNPETGYLRLDSLGEFQEGGGHRGEAAQTNGVIRRLQENRLVHADGRLTPKGIEEARRLRTESMLPSGASAAHGSQDLGLLRNLEPEAGETPEKESWAPFSVTSAAVATAEKAVESESAEKPLERASNLVQRVISTPAPKPATVSVAGASVTPKPSSSLEGRAPRTEDKQPVASYNEAAIDRTLVALLDPHSFEAEQFKILRTNILYPLSGQSPRSLLLTSTAPGEGKTFAAANLAISIALNINRHVLLIDADLRRPQMHERFGFGVTRGLSDYLTDGRALPSLLLRTKVDKLTLLPGGLPPENPSELISSERMQKLLAEVTERYPDRLIVIDAPPPAMAAETAVLARQVEGIIIVVRFAKSRRVDVAELVAQMGKDKIIGSIVNRIETPISRYYGYKYGGYRKTE